MFKAPATAHQKQPHLMVMSLFVQINRFSMSPHSVNLFFLLAFFLSEHTQTQTQVSRLCQLSCKALYTTHPKGCKSKIKFVMEWNHELPGPAGPLLLTLASPGKE